MIENGAVCGCLRADHRSLRDHVVCYHKAVAKACVEFPCWDCNRAFTSQKKLNAHTKSACKATRKERKRKRSSHETETTPDSQSKTDSESTSESKPEKKQKAEKAETQCCGYHFVGRQWNYERHRHTRHGEGFCAHMRVLSVLAGEAKWPCLWTGCELKFRRWELRKKHVERDHNAGALNELDPQPVARQDEVFVYRVRKSNRGQRERGQF